MKNKVVSINILGKTPPPVGGVTIHTLRLYQRLHAYDDLKVKLTALNKSNEAVNISFLWGLRKVVFGFKSDIVHYQGANYLGLIFLYFIKLLHPNFKLLLSLHGEGYINRLLKRRVMKCIIFYILKKIDGIVYDGEHLKQQFIDSNILNRYNYVIDPFILPNENDKKTYPQYIINIINRDIFTISATAFNIDKSDDSSDLYGLHILSKMAHRLEKDSIEFQMIIMISDINDQMYLNKLFEGLESVQIISDSHINGWQIISDSNLFIRPTSTDGNALSIYEALSFGVPVVASNTVPRDSQVRLFDFDGNLDDLYNSIIFVMNDHKPKKFQVEDNVRLFREMYISLHNQ